MLTLREFDMQDAPRITELLNCEEISKWTSNIPYPYTLQDAHEWLSGACARPDRFPYAVEYKGELVACVSYWPNSESVYEVGYWVGRQYWGKNIASSALSIFIAHDNFPKCSKIIAKIMMGNIASERVLLKNGFVFVEKCEIKKRGEFVEGKYFEKTIPS